MDGMVGSPLCKHSSGMDDIRTPLSMVMGYADSLSNDSSLSPRQHREADIIKQQSLVIKKLIEDLNLTSKLEYHMQPLKVETFLLAPFLRSLVVAYLNEMQGKNYDIELNIQDELESTYMNGDKALLGRAMDNLIGNSIRHNPRGCGIAVSAMLLNSSVCSVCIRDDGIGIPEQVVQALTGETPSQDSLSSAEAPSPEKPHIMGLRIARQIVLSHQGNFYFSTDRHGILMEFPVKEKPSSAP